MEPFSFEVNIKVMCCVDCPYYCSDEFDSWCMYDGEFRFSLGIDRYDKINDHCPKREENS